MDEKGSGAGGGAGSGRDEGGDARMGMIQINDLVYKLETDLSVAINRTHKNQYFQNASYLNTQTAIAIVNSGADYIDPRRSWFSFEVITPTTVLETYAGAQGNADWANAFVSFYFGKNGSVLNLIDSVVVSTRSGDELSRVNDFAQLMYMLIPEMFGYEWRDTVGQEMGFGSFIGGKNNTSFTYNNGAAGAGPPSIVQPASGPLLLDGPSGPLLSGVSEQRRQKFAVPLYLLSPIFNYGRLIPSMLMSGLRIEIKWKPLEVATQQFWEGMPAQFRSEGLSQQNLSYGDLNTTENKIFLGASVPSGNAVINNTMFPVATTQWAFTAAAQDGTSGILTATVGGAAGTINFNTVGTLVAGVRDFQIGDAICFSTDNAPIYNGNFGIGAFMVFRILDWINGSANSLQVACLTGQPTLQFAGPVPRVIPPGTINGVAVGAWKISQIRPLSYQRNFASPAYGGKFLTPSTPLTGYTINNPSFQMCAVQLTDAIQRTLNEFSSVNGLEIVYADYDRTSTPLSGGVQSVYTEIRKSASRALNVMARVTRATANTHQYDNFASCYGSFWNNYQFQLGSLYFPQQRVDDQNSDQALKQDNVLALLYSYTKDAMDRYHPKAPPSLATMRGTGIDFNYLNLHPTEVHAEHGPDAYLAPYAAFGKWGSAVNGATTVATTLERSTLFDLSGIPINNSRVLALRGEVNFTNTFNDANFRATLYAFLKYVRLARVFLVNCEVEQ